LRGAAGTIQRLLPLIIVERLKAPPEQITAVLGSYGYKWYQLGLNFLAIHPSDATSNSIHVAPAPAVGTAAS